MIEAAVHFLLSELDMLKVIVLAVLIGVVCGYVIRDIKADIENKDRR